MVFLVRVARFGSAAAGLLLAAGGIGGVAGALVTGRLARWFGTARLALAAGLFSLLTPLAGTGPQAAFYVAGAGVMGGRIVVGNIITGSFRQAYCPPSMLGRVTATMRFLVFGNSLKTRLATDRPVCASRSRQAHPLARAALLFPFQRAPTEPN
ncbi:MAG TPA: hypothetical protein VMV92_29375 [Streptosporangiaceae bacterium]|nr:hypothetical protein [Streptosporangiaceae bacterium]